VGRGVAALAGDANPRRYAGRSLTSYDLAREYGVTDTDGSQPNCWGYIDTYGIDEQSGRGVEEFRWARAPGPPPNGSNPPGRRNARQQVRRCERLLARVNPAIAGDITRTRCAR
jgi:hypothetical protein